MVGTPKSVEFRSRSLTITKLNTGTTSNVAAYGSMTHPNHVDLVGRTHASSVWLTCEIVHRQVQLRQPPKVPELVRDRSFQLIVGQNQGLEAAEAPELAG